MHCVWKDVIMKYNLCQFAGYLVADAEVKAVGAKKTSLCSFCLGVQVNKERDTVFQDCVAWGKSAEVLAKYIRKGTNLFVSGQLESSSWEDKASGKKRTKHTLNVREFQLLGDGQERPANTQDSPSVAADEDF